MKRVLSSFQLALLTVEIFLLLSIEEVALAFSLFPTRQLPSLPQQSRQKWQQIQKNGIHRHRRSVHPATCPLQMNFFKDMIDKAFENDAGLSNDKSLQQYDKPGEEYNDDSFSLKAKESPKTEVQKRWLASQSSSKIAVAEKTKVTTATSNSVAPTLGAPLTPSLLTNTKWNLSLYLTGSPDFDPSSSLFGARVNISTRKTSPTKIEFSKPSSSLAEKGFSIGADILPSSPNLILPIQFLPDGRCLAFQTPFNKGEKEGRWELSEDGKIVRFSVDVLGWKRTVTTKGSIQSVYWSEGGNVERKSQATYSIPAGWVYGEAGVGYGNVPGKFDMAPLERSSAVGDNDGTRGPTGMFRFERKIGILGAASKMLPCGMFSAEMVVTEEAKDKEQTQEKRGIKSTELEIP